MHAHNQSAMGNVFLNIICCFIDDLFYSSNCSCCLGLTVVRVVSHMPLACFGVHLIINVLHTWYWVSSMCVPYMSKIEGRWLDQLQLLKERIAPSEVHQGQSIKRKRCLILPACMCGRIRPVSTDTQVRQWGINVQAVINHNKSLKWDGALYFWVCNAILCIVVPCRQTNKQRGGWCWSPKQLHPNAVNSSSSTLSGLLCCTWRGRIREAHSPRWPRKLSHNAQNSCYVKHTSHSYRLHARRDTTEFLNQLSMMYTKGPTPPQQHRQLKADKQHWQEFCVHALC